MISLRSFRDPILVVLSLVAIWQVLHQLAGDSALTAPAPTLAHLWEMVWQPRFLPHLR
jgi:NitT/TauT family transport system permease protein